MRHTNCISDTIAALLVAVAAGASALPAHADFGDQLFKLLAEDGAAGDQFARWAAIDGNTTTGEQLFKLLPDDGSTFDWFGMSVAISGDTAIVAAWGNDDNGLLAGAAYLFDATTGQQIAKLLPDDGAPGDEFGFAVGISGTTALIGAWGDDDNGTWSGSAYIFDAGAIARVQNRTPLLAGVHKKEEP